MPRKDRYSDKLIVKAPGKGADGQLIAEGIVNYNQTATINGFAARVIAASATINTRDSGKLIYISDSTAANLKMTLPAVNQCNGAVFKFHNINSVAFAIDGDGTVNLIKPGGVAVNAAHTWKTVNMSTAKNYGAQITLRGDGVSYLVTDYVSGEANHAGTMLQE